MSICLYAFFIGLASLHKNALCSDAKADHHKTISFIQPLLIAKYLDCNLAWCGRWKTFH